MPGNNSFSGLLAGVRKRDADSEDGLWRRFFNDLLVQARIRMTRLNCGYYDPEDAALSTFRVIYAKLQQGSYPSLSHQGELWRLMITVLHRKIGQQAKYQRAAKRLGNTDLAASTNAEAMPALISHDYFAECRDLIASLNDPYLEQVAQLRFEGYTNEEIALKLCRTRRTIQRMLHLIREIWESEVHA